MQRSLHFGKYNGMSMMEVANLDPNYLLWAADHVEGFTPTPDAMAEAVRQLDRGDAWQYEDEDRDGLAQFDAMVSMNHEEYF